MAFVVTLWYVTGSVWLIIRGNFLWRAFWPWTADGSLCLVCIADLRTLALRFEAQGLPDWCTTPTDRWLGCVALRRAPQSTILWVLRTVGFRNAMHEVDLARTLSLKGSILCAHFVLPFPKLGAISGARMERRRASDRIDVFVRYPISCSWTRVERDHPHRCVVRFYNIWGGTICDGDPWHFRFEVALWFGVRDRKWQGGHRSAGRGLKRKR